MKKKSKPAPPSKSKITLKPNQIIFLILLLHLIISLLLFDPKLNTAGDNVEYLILSRSFINYHSFKTLYLPEEPESFLENIGFPLLLAGISRLFGENIIVLKIFVILLTVGALFFIYLSFLEKRDTSLPFLIIGILAISPDIFDSSRCLFTEMPFLLFLFAGLYFAEIAFTTQRLYYLPISAAFTCASCYIRSQGFILVGAILLSQLLRRNLKKFLILFLITIIFLLPFFIRVKHLSKVKTEEPGRIGTFLLKDPYNLASGRIGFGDFLNRVAQNTRIYFLGLLSSLFFPSFHSFVYYHSAFVHLFNLIILGLLFWGFVKLRKRVSSIKIVFLIFYIALILIWPEVWSSSRFLLPIFPFLLFFFLSPFFSAEKKSSFWGVIITSLVFLSQIITLIPKISNNLGMLSHYFKGDKLAGYSSDWRNYILAAMWLKENTPPAARVLARKPQICYYISQRKSLLYPLTPNSEEILKFIKDKNIDYILLDNFFWTRTTPRYLIPALRLKPEKFKPIHLLPGPDTYILEVVKDTSAIYP